MKEFINYAFVLCSSSVFSAVSNYNTRYMQWSMFPYGDVQQPKPTITLYMDNDNTQEAVLWDRR